ncbi:hypothetical protein LIER_24246 [Lithospermum erythrorhizon]|uniref:FAD-binding PCMH-type domain-containing protein n=1 Tax=Lithospermum erythrorhizon TaxID=34254 RepID=A0AAV3R3H1_LITER
MTPIIKLFSLFSVYLLISWVSHSPKNTDEDFLNCLQDYNSVYDPDNIYTRQTTNFTTILDSSIRNLRPQSQYSTLTPKFIITPSNEYEIQAVIYCSKKVGIIMKVRSGGHDYEGLSYISRLPFVIVDLRNYRSITFDTQEKTAWVEAGATLGELYYAISKQSDTLAFVAGSCPTVGVGGHFSGGGYSMMSRNFGLSVDHIIDAKIIDVNGRILDRKAMGEDLFWAIRGGGGASFGVITAWKINLLSVPEKVTVFNVTRTQEENATELVQLWQSIGNTIDQKLLIRLFIESISSTSTPGNRTISVTFTSMYIGGVEELLEIMQKSFPELGLVKEDCTEMEWIESILYFAYIDPKEESTNILLNRTPLNPITFSKNKSDYVTRPISKEGLEGIWKILHEENPQKAQLQLSPYGGKMAEISESETAFPHRKGMLFMIHHGIEWNQEEDSQKHINWIRNLYSYMSAHVSKSPRRAYMNYRDLDLGTNNIVGSTSYKQASKWALRYFNNNFNRLLHVKAKIDPTNFFRNEQSIPSLWKK